MILWLLYYYSVYYWIEISIGYVSIVFFDLYLRYRFLEKEK